VRERRDGCEELRAAWGATMVSVEAVQAPSRRSGIARPALFRVLPLRPWGGTRAAACAPVGRLPPRVEVNDAVITLLAWVARSQQRLLPVAHGPVHRSQGEDGGLAVEPNRFAHAVQDEPRRSSRSKSWRHGTCRPASPARRARCLRPWLPRRHRAPARATPASRWSVARVRTHNQNATMAAMWTAAR